MVRYCAIIFGCLALAEVFVFLTKIQFPSSIIGMLLLALFLKLGWIKLHWVKGISDLLIANLGLFFVPPCIKIMLYTNILKENWVAILVSVVVSTFLVMYGTAILYQFVRNRYKK